MTQQELGQIIVTFVMVGLFLVILTLMYTAFGGKK
jgi:hypothetical protein